MENLFTIEDMLKITWASLSNPISLAIFTVLFMQTDLVRMLLNWVVILYSSS